MKRLFFLALLVMCSFIGVQAQRVTDKLDRGLVAVPTGSGNLVTWRKFGSEYYDTQYNLYRNDTKIAGPISVSNFLDASGNANSTYSVEAIVKGVAQEKSAAVKAWANNYMDVPLKPVVNRSGVTKANSNTTRTSDGYEGDTGYTINDVSLADVTGDGVCEFIVKRNNRSGNLRSASNKTDFNLYECYKLDGTRLWWIDLGPNLMAGADEQWDMIGYDWDEDGKAEMIMRGADNMIIHTATGKTINIGDMTVGFNGYDRPEYMGVGNEYLLYLNGETGEPYGWDGSENWTPMAYPLPQFEAGETKGDGGIWGDLGHRMMKHYFGAPYLDGRHASIFLGRGCYTRHKFCALDVNPVTHELTQRWRWNCYDSSSPWFGNGFHNFQIADVDMDGRDEIMFGSMTIDDTGYGLATTGLGHGDAQHCGDLDPYRWGLEQFTCQEGSEGNSYWNATTGQIYYRKSDGGDDGRSLAGNFSNSYPGSQGRSVSSGVIGLSCDKIINTNGDAMSGGYSNLNMRVYWDGDLLDEIFNCPTGTAREPKVIKWGGSVIRGFGDDVITNNDSKCNPSAQGDILGDWREEIVLRLRNNSALRIFATTYSTKYDIYTLWDDHEYRNAMCWQNVGYNQPPHPSFFLGELEGITIAPPPTILQGRTEVSGTIQSTDEHLLVSGYEDKTISVADGASPWILTINTPAWVQGSGSQQATASTPKSPARTIINYTTTLTGGAFAGATRLVKQGEGTLVLPNVIEKHTGETNIWQGTLQFDGTMQSSAVWMNRHTTLISNGGQFLGGLKVDYNATVYPGGKDNVGSITASDLNLGFGSRFVFDVNGTSVDKVNANTLTIDVKTWEFGPKYKTPVFEFKNADTLADGKYELGSIGSITGNVEDILVEGIKERRFELQYESGKLYLLIETMRDPATVVWNGAEKNGLWDLAVTKNFLFNGEAAYSAVYDDIIFNDEAAFTSVNVKGAVSPKSMTFENNSKSYTLRGDSILGFPTLTKNGNGLLTISNENRLGNTVINGGKVVVNALANNTGIAYGALGDVNKTITINNATLGVNQPVITDQQVNVSGNVNIDVLSGMSLTFNKGLKGPGAVVTKIGTGSLTTGTANTYKKLVVSGGRVNIVQANLVDQSPDSIEFRGGVVWGANYEDGNGITNSSNFIVPKGQTGEFHSSFRGHYSGKLTGAGTFKPVSGGVRAYWNGDWSQFEGIIEPVANNGSNRQNKKSYTPSFNFTNNYGIPKATLRLNYDFTFVNQDPANSSKTYNVEIANVVGTGTLAGNGKYILGGQGDNIEAYWKSASTIVKRGSGYFLVHIPGNLTGPFTLEEGVLRFSDTNLQSSAVGTLTVMGGAKVFGVGQLGAATFRSGSELAIRDFLFDWPGVLKTTALVSVQEDAVVTFTIDSNDPGDVMFPGYSQWQGRFVTMNGTVKIEFTSNYTPQIGDEFTLWSVSTSFSGTPKVDLPALPDGMTWDVSDLAKAKGVIRIIAGESGINAAYADANPCNVYSLNGVLMSRQPDATSTAGLPAGIYIRGGKKIIVK